MAKTKTENRTKKLTLYILAIWFTIALSSVTYATEETNSEIEVEENSKTIFLASIEIENQSLEDLKSFQLEIKEQEENKNYSCELYSNATIKNCDDSITLLSSNETPRNNSKTFEFKFEWLAPFVGNDTKYQVSLSANNSDENIKTQNITKIKIIDEKLEFQETFSNLNLGTRYSSGNFTGDNNITWHYYESRGDNGYEITNKGLMFAENRNSYLKTKLESGINDFSIDIIKAHTSSSNRQIEIFINNISIGKSDKITDSQKLYTFQANDLKIEGNTTNISIINLGAQVVIDNIKWNSYKKATQDDDEENETAPILNSTLNSTQNITQNTTQNITNNITSNITQNISINTTQNISLNITNNISEDNSYEKEIIIKKRRSGGGGDYTALFNSYKEKENITKNITAIKNNITKPKENTTKINQKTNNPKSPEDNSVKQISQSTKETFSNKNEITKAPSKSNLTGLITGNIPTIISSLVGILIIIGLLVFVIKGSK